MDAESYPREYPFLSTESLSGPPANSFSITASFPPQGMPFLYGGWSDPLSLDVLEPQVNAEAYSAGLCPSLYSTILATDTAVEAPHPEISFAASDTHEDSPPTCPSETDTMGQTTISSCISPESTLRGSQDSWIASVNSDEDPKDNIFAEADTNRNRRQSLSGMPMSAPLDHGPQYTEIHATSDFSVLSTLPDNNSLSTAVQYQERASTEILQHPQNLGNGLMAASSKSPPKPSEDRYRCSICGLYFAQKRGVTRHCRDVHEVSLCLHCSGFEWHRRHQLKEHLEEQHPDIHVPAALAEATRYRRRATMIKSRLQGQQAFTIENYRWSRGENLPQPLMPPLPPVLEVTHPDISSPAVSRVAYYPQPVPTMSTSTNVTRRREYARELALFDATYAHVAYSSTEERAPPPNAVDVSFWG